MVYSIEDIIRYFANEMNEEEKYEIEKASLTDPFLSKALEGYENINIDDLKKLQVDITSLLNPETLVERELKKDVEFEISEHTSEKSLVGNQKIVDEETFIELISTIVNDSMPDEKEVFILAGDAFIHELFETSTIKFQKTENIDEFNFTENPDNNILFVPVTIALYKLLKSIYQSNQSNIEHNRSLWIKLMIQQGVPEIFAEKVAYDNINKFLKP